MKPASAAKRPNLLFLMADQFRHDFLGCAGTPGVRTPNLDRLAARGVRFTQCCTNAPVCAPARIALSAGLQPARLGALDNQCYLPRGTRTYYQDLRDHGYRVGCAGKLDLAKPDPYNGRHGDRPCAFLWGFTHPEEIEGKMHAGKFHEPRGPYGFYLQARGLFEKFHRDYRRRARGGWALSCWDSVLPAAAHADAYVGRRAVEWLERIPGDFPWHLFVSFPGPHDPFDPPRAYAARWRKAALPPPIRDGLAGKPAWVKRKALGATPRQHAAARRQYAAAVEHIDAWIGRILRALEKSSCAENTLVVFSSDHGEMLGDHGLYDKSVAYEGALRVPLLVAGPGVRGGRTSAAQIELIDVNPTLCEWAGIPPQPDLDARSFAGLLRGETDTHRTETLSMLSGFRCLRTERYKLIENVNDRRELYDLAEDPDELRNLAPRAPDLVRQLAKRLNQRCVEGGWMRG